MNRFLLSLAFLAGPVLLALGEEAYPLVYNFQLIPNYEYENDMAMTENNKDYYTVFIVVFQNKGDQRLQLNDEYEIITSKGEKHKAGFHPLVKKEIETRRKFSAAMGKIKYISPGETKYQIAVFDRISDNTPSFQFRIRGLPDADGQPNRFQVVAEYEHLKETVEKGTAAGRDPSIVWEHEPIEYHPDRAVGRWRTRKIERVSE